MNQFFYIRNQKDGEKQRYSFFYNVEGDVLLFDQVTNRKSIYSAKNKLVTVINFSEADVYENYIDYKIEKISGISGISGV